MQAILDFISEYAPITEEETHAMLNIIQHSSHEKNEMLHRQGEIPKRAAFIIKGAVRSYYIDDKGTEQTTGFTFENHPLVAFDSFANQTPSALNAIALEPTELIWANHADFFGFLETFPKYETALL